MIILVISKTSAKVSPSAMAGTANMNNSNYMSETISQQARLSPAVWHWFALFLFPLILEPKWSCH